MRYSDAIGSLRKTLMSFKQTMPMLIGVMLLTSLALTAIPGELFQLIFTGNIIIDPLIGALMGSISAGNPINSYIIGGELLYAGVSLIAVSAFIIAWVTVGIIQLPAESMMLGRRFAIVRNTLSFLTAIIISIILVLILGAIS